MPQNRPRAVKIAQMMIRRHGLHASAVAQEREDLARLQPDASGLELWRFVRRAIDELRSTASKVAPRQPQ